MATYLRNSREKDRFFGSRNILQPRPISSPDERISFFKAGRLAIGWRIECDNAAQAEKIRAAYPTFATIEPKYESPYHGVYSSVFVRLPFPVVKEDWQAIKNGLTQAGIPIPAKMETMASKVVERGYQRFLMSKQKRFDDDFERTYPTEFLTNGAAPLPFQEVAIEYIKGLQYRGVIGDDMGLGKTMSGICALFGSGASRKLVVTKNCLTPSFYTRLLEWTGATEKQAAIVVAENGTPRKRPPTEKELNERKAHPFWRGLKSYQVPYSADLGEYEILVVHYAILAKWLPRLLEWKPDVVVFDEAHTLCNADTQVTRSARSLSEQTDSVVAMTGTPGSNRPRELFHLFDLVFPYRYGDFHHFALRFCDAKMVKQPRVVFDKETKTRRTKSVEVMDYDGASNLKELFYRLRATGMVRRLKGDVLDQIPFTDIPITLTVSDAYLKKEEESIRACREAVMQGEQKSLLAQLMRLSAEEKIEWAKEWIPNFLESKNGPLVVFFHHNSIGDAMREFLSAQGVKMLCMYGNHKDSDFERRFQNDKTIEVALISYSIGRDGLTLTRAANMLLLEYSWIPGWIDQAKDRIRRIGQDKDISYHCPYFIGSVDERVVECVVEKKSVLSAVLDNRADTVLPDFDDSDGMTV